ncbi:hypothetical protein CCY99_09115 [Helicobacter sp. 16-1353]|uniref:ATP-grasp domain-containing protein n=1 Tax=Helicobacter sp. 16-1353 TaxID=2004996 RepID=UPI000DCC8F04|nr:ATP-grasp domain-containing protein [Helicobacter sp. 16-1353]RAX51429.1 hypothetical protein CCY99_09115 [Helicobacter sp. 16-1353]
MKKLLMLGGSYFQIPAIKKAKEMGLYVITCDYTPTNPGHSISHEYHNISTTDKNSILVLAKKLKIDGILAYASDPAAPIAAFVAENLGLPTQPLKSVEILTNKHLFRDFLAKNGFKSPKSTSFKNLDSALDCFADFNPPLILKPVDSSGSKGVFRIESKQDLIKYFDKSLLFSKSQTLILEEWIDFDGYQIAGDGFSINGELIFSGFANEHFDKSNINPFVPIGESFPYIGTKSDYKILKEQIQKVLSLLNLQNGAYNFDIRLKNKKVHFLEIGPRNGGNLIPQVIQKTFGVDLVRASICSSLGMDLEWFRDEVAKSRILGHFACYVLHSKKSGIFHSLEFKQNLKKDIVFHQLFIKSGDEIKSFSGSNATLGMIIFRSNSTDEMLYRMENMDNFIKLLVSKKRDMGGG